MQKKEQSYTDWAYYFDVSGYYNLIMINYDLLSRAIPEEGKKLYEYMYHQQLALKGVDDAKRQVYKTILLAVFGAQKHEGSDLYDLGKGTLVPIVGQMFLIDLLEKLTPYTEYQSINLHIVPFTEIQTKIYEHCREDYGITIMRRMMYRITEEVARRNKCMVITNGESIGQVASQTLTSMSVINEVTNMPVIRPVACLDKLEIIDIAKKIDTYETSILPFEDCCTVFVPKHPVINPKLDLCYEYENRFDYKSMIVDAVNNINTIIITDEKDKTFEDIL